MPYSIHHAIPAPNSGNVCHTEVPVLDIVQHLKSIVAGQATAQETVTLSLDSCRALAMSNNKELRMADSKRQAAYYERKAASPDVSIHARCHSMAEAEELVRRQEVYRIVRIPSTFSMNGYVRIQGMSASLNDVALEYRGLHT